MYKKRYLCTLEIKVIINNVIKISVFIWRINPL
jgi:hypothetical protein